jgi:hypothetical protein
VSAVRDRINCQRPQVKNPLGTAEEFANKSSDQILHRSGKGMRLRNGIGFLLSAALLATPGTMQELSACSPTGPKARTA